MTPSRIVLGTVQWGQAYGVANRTGQVSEPEAVKIMEAATKAGINTLDTARAYGTAEEVVGRNAAPHWRVITKLSPWVTGANVGPAESAERVERSLDESCDALDRDVLDGVLLHRADQRLVGAGAAWSELRRQRDRGRVRAIGVSVVKVDEADAAIEDPEVQLIQVPASLLDQRLLRSGFFDAAAERKSMCSSAASSCKELLTCQRAVYRATCRPSGQS